MFFFIPQITQEHNTLAFLCYNTGGSPYSLGVGESLGYASERQLPIILDQHKLHLGNCLLLSGTPDPYCWPTFIHYM